MGPHDEALRLLATREGQWAFEREGMGGVADLLRRSGAAVRFPDLPPFRHLIEAQAWSDWSSVTAWAFHESAERGLSMVPPPDGLPPNPVSSWEAYFDATARMPLHPLYRTLEPYLPTSGSAVELGSGNGPGPLFLIEKGLEVLAIDGQGLALASLFNRATEASRQRLTCRVARLQDVVLPPERAEVLVAGYCLFFLTPTDFARVWPMVRDAVRPGGLIMGQFLGRNDDWATRHLAHSRDQVNDLLGGFELLSLEEAERDGHTSQGLPKHWHVYHWIVRVPG